MARINIEDAFFKDSRYVRLCIALGSEEQAIGSCVKLWFLAQNYWKKGRRLIPKHAWEKQQISEAMVKCGFAEVREEGYYTCGSEKHFEWVYQRAENGQKGGLASGEARRSKINSLARSKPKQTEANASKPNPHSHSHSHSHIHSLSQTHPQIQEELKSLSPSGKPDDESLKLPKGYTNASWQAYSGAYLARWGIEPLRGREVNGLLGRFVKTVGLEDAPEIIRFYLKHGDFLYTKSCHPINLLLRDANKLRTEWLTGSMITGTKARQIERSQTNLSNFNEVLREGKNGK